MIQIQVLRRESPTEPERAEGMAYKRLNLASSMI